MERMNAPISRLDHVIIGVKDLAVAAKTFERLGFRLTPRGVHEGKGTGNHCVMFGNAYIELLGIVDHEEAARSNSRLTKLVSERGEGGIGLAYGGDDADEIVRRVRQAGIEAEDPSDLARPLDLDGERQMVRFRNVMLPKSEPRGLIQFVCTHLTPDLTRARHEWELHANGAIQLTGVTIIADDVQEPLHSWLRRLTSREVSIGRDSRISIPLENLSLAVATPDGLRQLFGRAASDLPKPPAIAVLNFAVHEPDAAAAMLSASHVPFEEEAGRLIVPAKAAHGVILVFEER
jgi:catechol 2,3-dioxygenase-like lactoylglutathione lyase family enzyme